MRSIQTKLKLENKLKTPKQKIVGWALNIVMCVRGMFETNLKLDNKPKTRKQKIVGWALSIVVCAWNVRNKHKTRKHKIGEDKGNLLQKVGTNKSSFFQY